MLKRVLKVFMRLVLIISILVPLTVTLPRLITAFYARSRLYTVQNAPTKPVAIVFGAGLWRDGSPTPVLRDRVATAADLYFRGKVEKLLMSGDNIREDYNEPGAMREYAIQMGVPAADIVLDYAGRRTYDTCFRAREIFHLKDVILVTQRFHLPRAIYTCNALRVSAVGVEADQREYRPRSALFWSLRELVATLAALWDVHVSRPTPVLGNPEPIFPMEAQ
jgi:SanA protein